MMQFDDSAAKTKGQTTPQAAPKQQQVSTCLARKLTRSTPDGCKLTPMLVLCAQERAEDAEMGVSKAASQVSPALDSVVRGSLDSAGLAAGMRCCFLTSCVAVGLCFSDGGC